MIDFIRLNHKMLWYEHGFNLKFPRIFETLPQHIDFTELRDNEKKIENSVDFAWQTSDFFVYYR